MEEYLLLIALDVLEALVLGLLGGWVFSHREKIHGGEPPSAIFVGVMIMLACFFVMTTIDAVAVALH